MRKNQKKSIENYITSYNAFDVKAMLKDIHNEIIFENIANGEVDLRTEGKLAFKAQAEKAKQYFSARKQKIESWEFSGDTVTIDINYEAVLAIDLPGGASKGDILELNGKSEFTFLDDEIITIRDYS